MGLAGELRLSLMDRNYQVLPDEGDDGTRFGGAAELFYQLEGEDLGGLRLALGYSFSDLPDPLLSDLFNGNEGVYLRLEGVY